MINRRQKSRFAPQDPEAVRARFKKIAARVGAQAEDVTTLNGPRRLPQSSTVPLRSKRAS